MQAIKTLEVAREHLKTTGRKSRDAFEILNTHNVKEAIKSEVEKLMPALHLMKFPVAVLYERSDPRARESFPTTPEKLTSGLAVSPMLVLIPTYSFKYWSSTC